MKKRVHGRFFRIEESSFEDVVFLIGVFIFFAVLVLGLFPGKDGELFMGKDFFVYAIMLVPTIAAIYFIIISFRRNLYLDSFRIGSSFKNKMVLAFVFVAILSSLPIIFAANSFFHKIIISLTTDRTSAAMAEAINMSEERKVQIADDISAELKSADYIISSIPAAAGNVFQKIIAGLNAKGYRSVVFDSLLKTAAFDPDSEEFLIAEFYRNRLKKTDFSRDRIHLNGKEYIAGFMKKERYALALFRHVPDILHQRATLFNNSMEDFVRHSYLQNYFMNRGGAFFISISLVVIFIAVVISLYLSRNITKPVLELAEASRNLAYGDFNVRLSKKTDDEIGQLITSFNRMVEELDNNRKLMYQKQVLESWRDIARRVVHEIKNPLTPIVLSAERMRKRYVEKSPDFGSILISGTDTIIEEVNTLKKILSEFTKFARLPQMNPEWNTLKDILSGCVVFFSGHEDVKFHLSVLDDRLSVYADKLLVKQAINNIIQNAVDAVGAKGNIGISAFYEKTAGKDLVKIVVSDDGIGILEEDLPNVFKPGFTKKKTGTGLGLSIVEKIIIEHGGRVYCKRRDERGMEFIIELPGRPDPEEIHG